MTVGVPVRYHAQASAPRGIPDRVGRNPVQTTVGEPNPACQRIPRALTLGAVLLAIVASNDADGPNEAAVSRVDVGTESFQVMITGLAMVLEAERRFAEEDGVGIVTGTPAVRRGWEGRCIRTHRRFLVERASAAA